MSNKGTEEQKCPVCSHSETPIIERRGSRRRRECGLCHHRWTTYEVPAERLELLEKIEHHAAALAQAINEGD